jgi:hypothetical protein
MIRESIDGRCWNWWLTLCRVAAAFQITRIGWTGTPDFPTVVANAEHAQGASPQVLVGLTKGASLTDGKTLQLCQRFGAFQKQFHQAVIK